MAGGLIRLVGKLTLRESLCRALKFRFAREDHLNPTTLQVVDQPRPHPARDHRLAIVKCVNQCTMTVPGPMTMGTMAALFMIRVTVLMMSGERVLTDFKLRDGSVLNLENGDGARAAGVSGNVFLIIGGNGNTHGVLLICLT